MRLLAGLLYGVLVTPALLAATAQSVRIVWYPSISPNIVGYNVYYGVINGVYTNELHAGNTTNLIISGLANGTTYHFSATAQNSSGLQSVFSGQTFYTVPGGPIVGILGSPGYSGHNFSFTVTGTPGYSYAIQTSSDLLNWTSVETNISPWTFTDTNSTYFRQKFYRSIYPP
jgi:Fibronectin type III domain